MMERTFILLLAFTAGILAGPISDINSRETCSTTCTDSTKFGYQPGTTYEYDYDVDTTTLIQGASEGKSGIKMTAKVQVEVLSKCDLVLKVKNVQLHERNAESPENFILSAMSGKFSQQLEENSLRFSFQDGRIESLCPADSETPWVLNIKRGILSMIQNTMENLQADQKVSEADVTGTCDADYTVSENGWYSVTIKKHKNLLGCTERHGYQTALQGTPYRVPSEIQSLPIMKSSHDCQQEISKSGILKGSSCTEQHVFRPFSRDSSGAMTESRQTLKYSNERTGVSTANSVTRKADMNFEHHVDTASSTKARKNIEKQLVNICAQTKGDVRPETPRLFSDLVHIMRSADSQTLNDVYTNVQSGALCSDNNQKVRKFFLDAVPMTGTPASVTMLTKMLTDNEVTGIEADMWMTTLAFIPSPSKDMIREVMPLLKKNGKALLAVSSLVNTYCKKTRCENDLDIANVISALEDKIGYGCYVDNNNKENIVLSLRALGNSGHTSSATATVNSCISRKDNPMEVRIAAIEAFRRASCDNDRTEALKVFNDKEEDAELRIAAYLAIMQCPSKSIITTVRNALEKEEVNQVGSFIWSHLTNLMESSSPFKQDIISILNSEYLKKEFDMDKRKYSRNYEGSFFLEKINTGASIESNLIWSSKSFIPRSLMANLTVDLFGKSVNILEIGGRVEGLEYFLESYFGPNGYFTEKDVKEATTQIVKGIDEKKMKKIDSQFGTGMDQLRGALYMRIFGNELSYNSFDGLASFSSGFNVLEMLISMSKNHDYTFTQNIMFMDTSMIIPTSAGFPLNLTINGTATIDMKASGKVDLRKLGTSPRSLLISGLIQPSTAVEISSMMSVDAFVTKSGLKMVSTVHSSTLLQGHVELRDGTIFNANLDVPKDKMEIFSVKTAFFTVHRDVEKEQNMITKNRKIHKTCTGSHLARITGLKLCGEIQFPNASLETSAPYFPLTGPISLDVSLKKEDSHKSYNVEARLSKTKKEVNIRLPFDTPGSQTDRALSAEFSLDKIGSKLQMGLQSPWNKAVFTGKVENEKNLRHISGKFVYNKQEYSVVAEAAMTRKGSTFEYTPHVEVSAPKMKSIQLKGGMKYSGMKLIDANLIMIGVSKEPIKAEVNFVQKRVVVIGKASFSFEKKKEYVIESRVQKYATAKAARYRPYLSIKTPEKELVSFGGSAEYKKGKAIKVDLTVDRIVSKPMKLSVQVRDASNEKSTGFRSKIDIKSPVFTTKLTSTFMLKNQKITIVRSTLDYVIPKVMRDKVTLNGKLNVANTDSLSAAKGNIILSFKQGSDYNLNANFDVSKNWKHSEASLTVVYGPNKKDIKKRIEFSSVLNHILNWKQKKFNRDANTKFIFPYLNVNYKMKGKHVQSLKSIDSSLDVVFGKKSSYSAAIELKDKSKKLASFVGKLGISVPGRDIVIGNVFDQRTAKKYTNILTIQLENGHKSIIESTLRNVGTNEYDISTSFNIPTYDVLAVSGQYRFIPSNFQANSEILYGKTKYAVSLSSLVRIGSRIQVAADLEYPARKVTAEFDTIIKDPVFSSKLDVKWDANQDLDKKILIKGDITYEGLQNMEATFSKSSPLGFGNVNLKHRSGEKYVSHAHAEWNKDVVSVDSSFGKKNDGYIADLKIESPFKDYRSINIGLSHQLENSKSISNIDVDWKPMKRMSSTLNMKRPLHFDDVDVSLEIKSPISGFERTGIELKHKIEDGVMSFVKFSWNKDFFQTDILAVDKSSASNRDLTGRLSVKSSLDQIASLSVSAKHVDNGQKFENSLNFKHNGNVYAYQGDVHHFRNGWQLQNSGNIKLSSPMKQMESSWFHRNTHDDLQSSLKFESGANVVDIQVKGMQRMSLPQGSLTFDFAMRSPFNRDLALAVSHEHGIGMIDNKIHYSTEGKKVISLSNVYKRNNGVADSSHVFTCHGSTKMLTVTSQYQQYPITGQIEYQDNGKSVSKLNGQLDFPPTGLMSGKIELISQFSGYESLKLSVDQSNERGEIVTRSSLSLPSRNTITMETRGQWGKKKSFNTILSTPYKNLQKMTIGADFTGDSKSFHTSANLMINPIVGPMSVTSQWSSYGGIIASIQINTPFEQHKKTRVSFTHSNQNEKKVTELNVEYLPGKIIKLESSLRPTLDNLEGSIALTTPFQALPYSAASLRHSGDSRQFQCHGEIEYTRGKKIQGDITFKNDKKMETTLVIRSPFANDLTAAINHEGTWSQFASHAEMQYGKSKKYEITGKYGNLAGDLSIKSPLHDDIAASFNHKGDISEFDSHIEGSYGRGKKYELTAKYNQKSGTIGLKSPLYEDISASFNHKGKLTDFVSQAEFQYGGSKKYEAMAKLSLAKTWTGSVSFSSPLTDDFATSFSHEGQLSDFQISADGKYGKQKGSVAAMFKKAKKTIGSLELKSSLIDNIKAEFSHEGTLSNFDTKLSITKAGKIVYEGSVSFSNGRKVTGSATLKTPFHKDISATFKHSGDFTAFQTAADIKMNKKTEYKLSADMVNKKRTKAKLQIENPFTDPITLTLVKKGKPTNVRIITNAILGKGQKYTVDITLKRGSNSAFIIGITTPLPEYKKMKGNWNFSGNMRNFKTSARAAIGKESVSADLKMSLRPNFKADVSIETPFKGLKKAGVVLSHQGSLKDFKSHGEITVGKSKLYNADVMIATDPKLAASFALQTPFRKVEDFDFSMTHDGSLRNFNNQVNLSLNKKRISSGLKIDTRSDITADVSIQTPFEGFEVLQGSLTHIGTWNDFQFHLEGLDGTNNKFTSDITLRLNDQIIYDMKLTTPFKSVELLKASLSHDGTINNFHTHGEFEMNNDRSEIDVNFSSLVKLEGRVLLKSAYIETVEGMFAHESLPIATSATLRYGNRNILDSKLSVNSSPLQGSLLLNSMYTRPLKAVVSHTGSMKKFNSVVEIAYGKETMKYTTEFDSTNDISAKSSIVTSFGTVKSISSSVSHAGGWSNFKCHADVSINGKAVEGDVAYNSRDSIEGSVVIKTPFENYRESELSFRHNGGLLNFNSRAEYSLEGQKSEVELTIDTDNKVHINVLMKSPSIHDISFKLNHNGYGRTFKSETELKYGGEKKIEGEVSFEAVPKMTLSAVLKSKCPVVKSIQISISQEGTFENFNVQASASFNDQRVSSDVRLDSRSGLNGRFLLTTPVSEEITASIKHEGQMANFKTVSEVSYSGRKQIELDAAFRLSQSVTGQFSLKTPISEIADVNIIFRHDGNRSNFKCSGSASISGDQKISGDISFNSQPLSGAWNIRSVFGNLDGAFDYALSSRSMNSHVEINVNGKHSEADMTYSNNGIQKGSISLSSPFNEKIGASFTHDQNDDQISSSMTLYSLDKTITGSTEISFADGISGKLSLITPTEGYEQQSIIIKYSNNSNKMSSSLTIEFNNGQKIDGQMSLSKRGSLEGKIILSTPFEGFRESKADFTYDYSSTGLTASAKGTFRQQSISADMSFDKVPFQGSAILRTPFVGFEEIKTSFNHASSDRSYKSHIEITMRGKTVQIDSSFSNKNSISAATTIMTPIKGYSVVSVSLNHEMNVKGFSNVAKARIENNEVSVEATFSNMSSLAGNIKISTPFSGFEKQSGSFVLNQNNIRVEAAARDQKIEIEGTKSNGNGQISLKTPFEGFKSQEISMTSTRDSINVRGIFRGKTIELDASFLTSDDIQGTISLKTPFKGFEEQGVSMSYEKTLTGYQAQAKSTFQKKKIELSAQLTTDTVITGDLEITSSYSGYERQKISVKVGNGNINVMILAMQHTVELKGQTLLRNGFLSVETTFPGFENQRLSLNIDQNRIHAVGLFRQKTIEINGELSAKKGSLSIKTPFDGFKNQYIKFTAEGQKLIAEGTLMEKTVEIDALFNKDGKIEGELEIRTPFEGFKKQAIRFSHHMTNRGCQTHADVLFNQEKSEFDLSIINELNKEFKVSLKTPITGYKEQVFCVEAVPSPNGLKVHSEVHFDKKKVEADFNYEREPQLLANLIVKTPFTGFESTSISFQRDGSLRNMQLSSSLEYGSSQTVSLFLRNIIQDSSSEHVLKFQSPYSDLSAKHTQSSENGVFQSQSDLSFGSQYSISHSNLLRYSAAPMLDFTSTTTYTIDGATSTSEMKVYHMGELQDFKTELMANYENEEASLSVQFKSTSAIEGSFSIKSPVPYLRNVHAKFTHSGDQDQFTTSSDFQHEDIGKLEGTMTFFKQNWRRVNSNLVIKTPFVGFEQTKLNLKHTANRNSIRSFVDVSFGDDNNVRASVKGSLEPMEVDLVFTSPFDGIENLHASTKYSNSGKKYNAEFIMSSRNKAISLKSLLDLDSSPVVFETVVNTPFSGLETSKFMITGKGSLRDFTSSIDLQSFWLKMKSSASLRYSTFSELDSSFSLSSDMNGLENFNFGLKNERTDGEFKNQMTASWENGQSVVSTLTYSSKDSWGKTTQKGSMMISTPFTQLRKLNIQSSMEKSATSFKQSAVAEFNGGKVLDMDIAYTRDAKHTASLAMREPQPLELKAEVLMSDAIKSGILSMNLDTTSTERQATVEMKYTTDRYNQKKQTVVKIVTPSRSVEVRGSGEMSSSRIFSSWDTLINNAQVFGFDAEHSLVERPNNYENMNNLKLRFPERSVAMSSSYQGKYGRKTVRGSISWDADRDINKKLGVSASLIPQGDSLKADVSLEIPSIGKDVKLGSEMTLNSGSVLFDGKTEFKYSKDEDKTVVINSRIENISTYSNKNYTLSFGVRHVFSSVNIQLQSHVGISDNKYSSGINVDYLTAKRMKKNFALMGEIDSLRRQMNVEVVSPIKSMRMSGKIETSPYRLSLRNVYDDSNEINSLITFDTEKKLIEAQTSYDIENPANVLHFVAKYVNASAILAEVYREENSRRITDSLFAMRLNTSRILHTRIHWRPTMINDLKVSGLGKISLYSRKMNTAFSEVADAVGKELNSKYNLIREAASNGYRPYGIFLEEMIEELSKRFPSADFTMLRNLIKSNTVQWQAFPGKDKYDLYVEFTKEMMTLIESRGGYYYAELMDVIGQQFLELSASLESAMIHYEDAVSRISKHQLSEYIGSKYDSLLKTATEYQVPDIASQYTNAIYDVRDQISSRMNGPVLATIKEAAGQSYHLGNDAYKFWEVEENIKSVMKNIFEMIKKDIEEEFSILKNSASFLRIPKITVFDLKSGELQMDTYLPVSMTSLQEIPKFTISKFTSKLHSYFPKYRNKMGSLSEYIPDSDASNWVPPFKAVAYLRGDHFTTFDGKEFDFSGKCSYVLTRDYIDGNFSIIINYLGKNKKQLIITTATKTLQIAPNGKLRIDGKISSAPYQSTELKIVQEAESLNVNGRGFSVKYNIPRDELKFVVSGWYHGKLGGLFGTNNNEIYDDMMTSSRRTVVDVDPFVNSWEVDRKCR